MITFLKMLDHLNIYYKFLFIFIKTYMGKNKKGKTMQPMQVSHL